MSEERKTVLICTVGGSYQPIVKSIQENNPSFVCFLCTDRDPMTGAPGSNIQIIGKGNIIKANPTDPAPTLPNIPTQANLPEGSYEVVIIPSDNLDEAFCIIQKTINSLRERFKNCKLIADYTGGTKTMTAALVIAALETDDVDLHLVTGNRADLVRVRDGTEHVVTAIVDQVRLQRRMAPFLKAWQRFAYDEAAQGLSGIPIPINEKLRRELLFARDFSRAFADWDKFDHKSTLKIFENYKNRITSFWLDHYLFIKALTNDNRDIQEPAQLIDLWLNSERRAAQGRYDDAVARIYRFIEWFAQFLLRKYHNLDTGNLDLTKIPEDMRSKYAQHSDDKIKIGLLQAWELLGKIGNQKLQEFYNKEGKRLLNYIYIRNNSILAHGFSPICQSDYSEIKKFIEENIWPLVVEEAGKVKVNKYAQLPTQCYLEACSC